MKRRGRPTKPIEQHKIDGTYRKDRHAHRLRAEGFPVRPAWLDEDEHAARLWERVTEELLPHEVLASLDSTIIEVMCSSYSDWHKCRAALAEMGAHDDGFRQLMLAKKTARDSVLDVARELGMSPSSRASLAIMPRKDDADDDRVLTAEEMLKIADG